MLERKKERKKERVRELKYLGDTKVRERGRQKKEKNIEKDEIYIRLKYLSLIDPAKVY